MCAHDTPQEARRCVCTGYGLGDPPCRCGYLKSQHEDGTGRCLFPSARCHEFVLKFVDPFPVTADMVAVAMYAVMADTGLDVDRAREAAMAALFAGHDHAIRRDRELETTRAANDRLRRELAASREELRCLRESAPTASV